MLLPRGGWFITLPCLNNILIRDSNLTMANHVIFVAPYLTSGSNAQQLYDAARTQARGRAHRFGQKKVVTVYNFITDCTIDVDILEHRTGKFVKACEKEDPESGEIVTEYILEDAESNRQSIHGSRLHRDIFSGDQDD